MVGELFGSFSLTVTAALLASLLVSLTVVPVLSFWFLRAPKGSTENPDEARRKAEEKEARSRLQRLYVPVLRFATRRRITSIVIAVAVLFGTFGMAPLLKTNFFDQGEQEVLSIKQELVPGTSLAAADEAAKKVETLLDGDKGVKDYQVTVGSSGFMAAFGGGTGSNQASYQVTLKDSADFDATQKRIDEGLGKLDGIGDTTIAAGDGFGSQDLSVVVKSADADTLKKASEEVRAQVAELKDVTDVQSDLAQSVPRISVKANAKARPRLQPDHARCGCRRSGARHPVRQGDHGRHRARRRHQVRPPGHHDGRAEEPLARPGQARSDRRGEAGPRPGLDDEDRRPARRHDHRPPHR